jgi:hypothetical protein
MKPPASRRRIVPPPPRLPPPRLSLSETHWLRGWAAERAKTTAAATETAARDAAQVTAREKAALEARVSERERDLGTAMTDLATTGRQFSQVTNQLQVATEEMAQLRENNEKLS